MKQGDRPECCDEGIADICWRDKSDRFSDPVGPGWCMDYKKYGAGAMFWFMIFYCPWCGKELPREEKNPQGPQPHRVTVRRENGQKIVEHLLQPLWPVPNFAPGQWFMGVKLPTVFRVEQTPDRTEIIIPDAAVVHY